jgi:uncharacterized membrane protein HdeD (DUF308 family)
VFGAQPTCSAATSKVQPLRARAATNFVRLIASVLAIYWPLVFQTLPTSLLATHSIASGILFVEFAVEKRRKTLQQGETYEATLKRRKGYL